MEAIVAVPEGSRTGGGQTGVEQFLVRGLAKITCVVLLATIARTSCAATLRG